jgi:hypothetical protein
MKYDVVRNCAKRWALDCLQESAFKPEELEYYEKYWDAVRVEKSAIGDVIEKEQQKQAVLQNLVEEERKQKEKGALLKLAKMMKSLGKPAEDIMNETGLSRLEIDKL